MDYEQLYANGNESEIWDRLCDLDFVREPQFLDAARSIAREAMRRTRRNIERLALKWEQAGHRFGYEWAGQWAAKYVATAPPLLDKPHASDLAALDRYEHEKGPLPIVLRAFYEVIGAVNFVGDVADGWPEPEILDPLQVQAFLPQLAGLLEDQTDEIVICPDNCHKYFRSGVGSLTVQVPSSSFDAVLRFEDGELEIDGAPLTFGRYLRDSILKRGGIGPVAGFNDDAPDPSLIAFLTQDLEPF